MYNREVKFRAWNKVENKMRYEPIPITEFFDNPIWIPMQYTGLKDKEGTEIYEGDILENSGLERLLLGKDCGVVVWNKGLAQWDLTIEEKGRIDNTSLNYVLSDYKLEVTGNKFENPELLNN